MDQERKVDAPADDRSKPNVRKRWHAPRFFATDVTETSIHPTGGAVEPAQPTLHS